MGTDGGKYTLLEQSVVKHVMKRGGETSTNGCTDTCLFIALLYTDRLDELPPSPLEVTFGVRSFFFLMKCIALAFLELF